MASHNIHCFSKVLTPLSITLGAGISTKEFGEDLNIQFTAIKLAESRMKCSTNKIYHITGGVQEEVGRMEPQFL